MEDRGDNRAYVWDETRSMRPEYPYIQLWIAPGARVIDLGCGNGSLLHLLKERKSVTEFGIEIAPSGVTECYKRGLKVRQGRIDVVLTDVPDQSFDYAICNVTSQMVMYPEVTLAEMRRIAHHQIVSFPNLRSLPMGLISYYLGGCRVGGCSATRGTTRGTFINYPSAIFLQRLPN